MPSADEVLGVIIICRFEVLPFTEGQIALMETFAAQAAIAIENVRLFNETKEALEQQTATSELLRVIASSPTDLQAVLKAMAESAARLCEATDVFIHRVDDQTLPIAASTGNSPRCTRPARGFRSSEAQWPPRHRPAPGGGSACGPDPGR